MLRRRNSEEGVGAKTEICEVGAEQCAAVMKEVTDVERASERHVTPQSHNVLRHKNFFYMHY